MNDNPTPRDVAQPFNIKQGLWILAKCVFAAVITLAIAVLAVISYVAATNDGRLIC